MNLLIFVPIAARKNKKDKFTGSESANLKGERKDKNGKSAV